MGRLCPKFKTSCSGTKFEIGWSKLKDETSQLELKVKIVRSRQ